MTNLQQLKETLEKLDPNKTLEGKAYDLTYNDHLGLSDASDFSNFFVGIPYGAWPADVSKESKNFESKLAIAFKEVFEAAIPKNAKPNENVYIDITQLWGYWVEFFNRRIKDGKPTDGGSDNLAHWIGKKLLDIPKDAIPVIRILIGGSDNLSQEAAWKTLESDLKTMFWPKDKCKYLLRAPI
jgi:hypothetical protein